MRHDWNPDLYARFSDERVRPVFDLLARVPLTDPRRIVDLGCGAGASTAPLVARWPAADVLGIDTSPAMIEAARGAVPGARFALADIGDFEPEAPVDLIFSNAALQWVGDHRRLLPRLLDRLTPGGVLAVQVPDTLDQPSHRAMRDTAAEPRFAAKLAGAAATRERLLDLDSLYDVLAPLCDRVDLWRTAYVHPLAGVDRIVEMVRSAGLRPFLDPLDEHERDAYLAAYRARIAALHRPTANGVVLFAFPRLFFVAVRAGGGFG